MSSTPQSAGFRTLSDWAQLPEGWSFGEVTATAIDSRDRVFVFNRGAHPLQIFDRDGRFLESWGESLFARPHGITIAPDDTVWCVDDLDHTVKKFSPRGELLLQLGTSGRHSDTGATTVDYRTILHEAGPFNFPTNLALAANGELYITDGYGNARVHRYSPEGELISSWGEPGAGPGQFHLPHGIAIAKDGTVFVADRENSRLQLFDPAGRYLDEWTDIARPCQVFIAPDERVYVAEVGYRAGMWPGTHPPTPSARGGCVSIFDRTGHLQARWGGGDDPCAPGDFFAPHDIKVDRNGAIYVSEVVLSAGGNRGLIDPSCHTLQKFEPVQ